MGEMADFALDQMMDDDEAYCRREIDEDTGYEKMSPFQYHRTPNKIVGYHGPGKCPKCKGPTHLCYGPYGAFYGCNNFPECKGRRSD